MFKTFNNKNLCYYHDLYVQSDALLLDDVFENFRNQCLKIYGPDPANFLTLPSLTWQACLKTTNVQSDLLTDSEMLLIIEDGVRGGIINKFSYANNKYMSDYDKNEDSLFLRYLDVISLYAWAMCQKPPAKNF